LAALVPLRLDSFVGSVWAAIAIAELVESGVTTAACRKAGINAKKQRKNENRRIV
jgi:hypothetical protein